MSTRNAEGAPQLLGWWGSASQLVFFIAAANFLYVMLASLGYGLDSRWWDRAYVHPWRHESFINNYVALMIGVIGVLIAGHIAILIPHLLDRGRSERRVLNDLPIVRQISASSVVLVALTSPASIAAVACDFDQAHAHLAFLMVLVPLPLVLALAVGRLITYSATERMNFQELAQVQDGALLTGLREDAQKHRRKLPIAGAVLSLAVLLIGFGATKMLTSDAGPHGAVLAFYILMLGIPFFACFIEGDALTASAPVSRGMNRAMYWVLSGSILLLSAVTLLDAEGSPDRWIGLGLIMCGMFTPLLKPWWSSFPRLLAIRSLEKRMDKRRERIKSAKVKLREARVRLPNAYRYRGQ